MLAAVSNRVEALERIKFGKLDLPKDLPLGEWTWVDAPSEILLVPYVWFCFLEIPL